MKTCSRCKTEKYAVDFSRHARNADGLDHVCRACHKKYREENRENYVATRRRYREKNREFIRAKGREYARINVSDEIKQYRRSNWLRNKYGVTDAWYRETLSLQGGVCAVCKEDKRRPRDRHLHIDHDHVTGKVRGILCLLCNQALGKLKDSPQLLRAAAEYLEQHRQKEIKCV